MNTENETTDRTSNAAAEAWHTQPVEEILRRTASPPAGLSSGEAAKRLRTSGPNLIHESPGVTILSILAHQFESPFIWLLIGSAALAVALAEFDDAAFIGVVLALNAALGFLQEFRAERGARRLKRLMGTQAVVERDSRPIRIDARDVVPGDLIRVESGDAVPADARIVSGWSLEADESILTGESIATTKDAAWCGTGGEALGDIRNMIFAGTTIARGRASAVVVATGSGTQLGGIAESLETERSGVPPLVRRMRRFARTVALAVAAVAAVIAMYELAFRGSSLRAAIQFAVALVISAVPEGLPIALTIALAIGTMRMSRRNVIVRRLAAVEALGSCTLVATDKTGTLTCNELTVKRILVPGADGPASLWDVSGEGFDLAGKVTDALGRDRRGDAALSRIVRAGLLCNEADLVPMADGGTHRHGDAVDLALLVLGRKGGGSENEKGMENEFEIENANLVHRIAYEPELRFAATWHEFPNREATLLCVKGSPARVLEMCELTDEARARHQAEADALAARGYRVIALAERRIPGRWRTGRLPDAPANLEYLGAAGMIDPARPGVREAIGKCRGAGVRVVMVTGDHALTAQAIAADLGLADGAGQGEPAVVTGERFETLAAEGDAAGIASAAVFARMSSSQKFDLVQAFQRAGHFVAVTGDGANDAQALKAADLAIAMGRSGTDIARDSADLVLTDDNFASIVSGIEEGRIAYDNIRKVIVLLVSTGAGELALVLLAMLAGYPLPLLPLQLLWLNVATEAIQDEALAFEPSEGDVMQRRPRPPTEPIFDRIMIERIAVGAAVMGFVGFGLFVALIESGHSVNSARNHLLLLMVLFENVHIGNCRSEWASSLGISPLRNPLLVAGAATALGLHLLAMHTPWFQRVLQVEPVTPEMWCVQIGLAMTILPAVELHKWYRRRWPVDRFESRNR